MSRSCRDVRLEVPRTWSSEHRAASQASDRAAAVRVAVRRWVEEVVVGLGLCPFARREVEVQAIRYVVSDACSEAALLARLAEELLFLCERPDVETTLLIHPDVLQDFDAYIEFLSLCDTLLEALALVGEFQVASFHPNYRFAGVEADAAENYSNRSPYPLLHLLREASVAQAVDNHPDTARIPRQNVARLRALGVERLRSLVPAHG